MYHDKEYLKLIDDILKNGIEKEDRTGTGTISLPFPQMRFDLSGGCIPLLTTKKMHTRSIIYEILWYLRGDTNIKYLNDNGVRIWDDWALPDGSLGKIYGYQWRHWDTKDGNYIDQIAIVIDQLKNNPDSRRIIVNAWNVGDLDQTQLPPCHCFFQFWSAELTVDERTKWMDNNVSCMTYDCPMDDEGKHEKCDRYNVPRRQLRCHLYQRSADGGLGIPFNIVQYSILTHMIAQVTNHVATEFVWTGGDVHIYSNHIEQLEGQLELEPYQSPTLKLNHNVTDIDDFTYEDFEIVGYESHPIIKMPVAV